MISTHMHKYKLESHLERGHRHRITGYADIMLGFDYLHFHYISGVSSYTNHTHYFSGFTGLPVRTENGHVHKIEVILEQNDLHEHKIRGYSYEEVSYISGNAIRGAFI